MKVTQNAGVKFFNGTPLHIPNEVRENSREFYISYNSSSSGYGCPTTALVLNNPQMTKFYILCGDHRKQFEEAETLEQCFVYFQSNPDKQHEYSDKLEDDDTSRQRPRG